MSVQRPDAEAIGVAAEHFGLHLDAPAREEFVGLVDGALGSYDVVEELYAASVAPVTPAREYVAELDGKSNPLGAWYVTTSVTADAPSDTRLAGRRVAIKDNVALAGVPMMNGSRTLEGFTPSRDATVVSRLLDAGAEIAGKAVCEDLCFSGSSFTPASGPVRNPWDLSREAGGSSGGSAALVANGDVDLAIGGDQGGSIRIPASFCGVVGHKPTFGLVPYTGAFPIERTIDHVGPIARTVADAALMLSVIAGYDGRDPRQPESVSAADYLSSLGDGVEGMRIGVVAEGFGHEASQAAVDDTVQTAAQRFTEAGAVVEQVSIQWHRDAFHVWNVIATDGGAYQMLDGNGYGLNAGGLYDPEQMEYFAEHRIAHADALSETVKLVALCGHHGVTALGGSSYGKARNLVPLARAAYDAALQTYDVLVMPTLPYVASELPDPSIDRATYLTKALGMIANTAPLDVTGHPALSVPAGLVDGLPVGMMIIGKHHDDATVLRVGQTYEHLTGGFPTPSSQRAGTMGSQFAPA
ncbi:amidase AmdA [Gordonia polyisoprenivorans VH2]|uniref:Amidase AmdA n=1 Tax=Gordonia polyisoprenivorans (strain DSM 44266 / VH2) TaxID=1112204 RepID=H6MWW0_GORPV|nr:amidase [Gordonia polyisoprenivorans]AFA71766.1 amidase AmdA [Gordonia polyisoprenivorans VH2]